MHLNKITQELQGSSFGYHSSGSFDGDIVRTSKLTRIADVMRKITFVALTAFTILSGIGIVSSTGIILGSIGFIGSSGLYYSSTYFNYKQICKTAGIVFQNAEQINKFVASGVEGKCEAIPTEHCADTELWRENLIKAAEHNIVLSGNYCGGTSFAKLINLFEKKIKSNPNIKIVIISSPNFIKNGNLEKVKGLSLEYPDNFCLVESPDIWHVSTGLKKSTNHTKCMVIDYGKYFILGGSGVKDNFAQTGLDHLTKEQFLNNRKKSADQQDGSLLINENGENPAEDGIFKNLIPGNFRDMDFIFKSTNYKGYCSGKQVYKQMLLLCHRWDQYNKMLNKDVESIKLNVENLALFSRKKSDPKLSVIAPEDSLVVKLLKTPIPDFSNLKTKVDKFDRSKDKCSKVAFKIFASGPEHNSSKFAEELEKAIINSKNQIVINHMYFHPTKRIMNALIDAAKRGVKIKVITAGVYKDCPTSHLAFGPRNKYNYSFLLKSLSEQEKSNIEIYEFQQIKKGLHKKVILIDDLVIAGSSNLGYKSLETASDHELNFFAKSKSFVEATMKICDVDIKYSKKIENSIDLSITEYFQAFMHRLLAPLIG